MKYIALVILLIFSHVSFGKMSGLEIMTENNKQRKVSDESVVISMKLINKKGKIRNRTINLTTQTNEKDEQNSLIKFTSPKNISGTGLLTIENQDADDDQWLYLPALKRSRRISPANQSDPFMGTDFSYEDLNTEDLTAFKYNLISTETIDNVETYKVKAIPANEKEAKESGYDHRIIWVRKSDFIITKVDYYDKQKNLAKTLTATDIRKVKNTKVSRPHLITMKNLKTNHSTQLSYGEYTIDQGLSRNQFSMRSLERGW